MSLVTRGNPGAVAPAQPPRCLSQPLRCCFCSTRVLQRISLQLRSQQRYPGRKPRRCREEPGLQGGTFTLATARFARDGFMAMPRGEVAAVLSLPWLGGSSRAGPPSPCVRHGASSPAQLLVEPRGGTSPTSPRRFPTSWRSESTAPSLRVSGMSEPSLCARQLCLSSPHKFLGIGWRAKIWHPATQKPSTEIRFREFVGIWVTPGSLQNTPGARGGSIWLRAHSGFSPGLCLQVVLGVRAMRESTEGH